MTKARSTKILAAMLMVLLVLTALPTFTLPVKAADAITKDKFTVGDTIYTNDFSGDNPLQGWTTEGNGSGWQWNPDYGSAAVDGGTLNVSSSGGTKVVTLPAVGTTNYAYSATFTVNSTGGSWGLLADMKNPASSSASAMHAIVYTGNGGDESIYHYNRNGGSHENKVYTNITEKLGKAAAQGDTYTLTLYHYNGNSYFFIGDTFISSNTISNNTAADDVVGIYTCGASVAVSSVTVKELDGASVSGGGSTTPETPTPPPAETPEEPADPYVITTAAQLADTATWGSKPYVKLGNNIDMTGVAYTVPGVFAGVFDGDGHVISNLTVNSDTGNVILANAGATACGGLIGILNGGTVKNVALIHLQLNATANASGQQYGGLLAGCILPKSVVSNVLVEGKAVITRGANGAAADIRFGTFAGYSNGGSYTIEHSALIGSITGSNSIYRIAGNNGGITVNSVYLALDDETASKPNGWTGNICSGAHLFYCTGATGTAGSAAFGGKTYAAMGTPGFYEDRPNNIRVSHLYGNSMGLDTNKWVIQNAALPIPKVLEDNVAMITEAMFAYASVDITADGAGIRYSNAQGATSGAGTSGLRFRVTLSKKDAYYQMYYTNGTYAYDADKDLQFGVLLLPRDLADGNLTKDTPKVIDLPLTKVSAQDDDTVTFMVSLLDIPTEALADFFVARAYAKIKSSGEWVYLYEAESKQASPAQIANMYYLDIEEQVIRDRLDAMFTGCAQFTGAKTEKITFTMLADFHYKTGMYMSSIADMQTILDRANAAGSDLILHLGDFCNDYIGSPELFNTYLNNNYELPALGVYGNHELESGGNSMDKVTPLLNNIEVVWGTADGKIGDGSIAYYYYDIGSYRFIGLDTNYSWNETKQEWQHNTTASWGPPSGNTKGNSLGPVQLAWLEDVLDDAAENDLHCVILSHESFSGVWSAGGDAAEARALFNAANAKNPGTVMMALNGHLHTDHVKMIDNILYVDVNTVRNGDWRSTTTAHYTGDHTFDMIEYDAQGNPINTVKKQLSTLGMGNQTWFFEEPLSANVTIYSNGRIVVEGMETDWIYGVASPYACDYITPKISSGVYAVPMY